MALTAAPAIWFDGTTARRTEATVAVDGDHLTARAGEDTLARWPLDEVRRVRDPGRAAALLYRLGDDGEARIALTDPEDAAGLAAMLPDLDRVRVSGRDWRKVGLWTGAASAAFALAFFVLIPAMADTAARLISPEQEAAIGDRVVKTVEAMLSGDAAGDWVCTTPAGDAALGKLTARLLDEDAALPEIRFAVVDHEMPNAFAAPGGRIVLFRGLLDIAETPEEIASVLAHELGHTAHRDPIRLTLRSAGSAGVLTLVLGDATGGAFAAVMAEALIGARHSRAAEAAADVYAHGMMAGANMAPAALGTLFARMADEVPEMPGALKHFSSHPDFADRIAAADGAAPATAERPVLTGAEWAALKSICAGTAEGTGDGA